MKKAVSVVLAGIFAALVCGTAFARDCKNPGKFQEKRVERLSKELNLSADQKTKIEAIFKENEAKRKAEMEKMREAAKAAKAETDQKIKAVLTPEQADKFTKMQEERKENMGKRMKKGPGKDCRTGEDCPPCPGEK